MDKYNARKLKNQELTKYIDGYVSEKTLERIERCNNTMRFITDEADTKKKQVVGESCNNPFCPICVYREAKKDALKIAICMKYIEVEHEKDFIFMHLTSPNVKADKLSDEITRFNKAFKNLMKRKEVISVNKGYIRKLEVTYNGEPRITSDMWCGNAERHIKLMADYFQGLGLKVGDPNPNYDTYHTHFHVVIAVNKSYFSGRTYVKQEKWLNMWRDVMEAPEITQVFVQRLNKSENSKEVQEVAKYTAKSSDYMISLEVFDVFYKALSRRQKITYNGLFAEANKLFKAKKLDKYKYVDETEYVHMLLYRWGKGEYVEEERRELTEDERRRYNKVLVDELTEGLVCDV